MESRLDGAGARSAILGVAILTCALLCYQAGRLWISDRDIHSETLEKLTRGAALEPGNAAAWDALGRFRQLDFNNPDPAGALEDYQRAVRADPLSAHYWMNLASAYEANGDTAKADEAFQQARLVYPLSAEVAWNYGNFLLRQSETEKGYSEIHHAVLQDPKLLTLAISRTWSASRDVHILLDRVLPADGQAYLLAMDYFSSIKQMDAALEVWERLVGLGKPVALDKTFPFFDELIAEDRSQEAQKAWAQALSLAGLNGDEPLNHSLIWNGNFAHDFLGGGLGWRWKSPGGLDLTFDTAPQGFGVRSVEIVFGGGSNLELYQPLQYVPVEPNRSYRFHAYMRTESISTEMGMRFWIGDPNHQNAVRAFTDNLTGSHAWTATDVDVVASPDTRFLSVCLYRQGSRLFENKLSGTVWIADVSLVPNEEKPSRSAEEAPR